MGRLLGTHWETRGGDRPDHLRNSGLIERRFTQIDRVMKINGLQTLTDDVVVEAARSTLVIGAG